ncbi:hypothetical protein SLEP1_g55563 [Rubroshorea leprosula]|uniref:Uncharacterized protein n=1 Tax=Rubroshorea leprosula TaxID=152421 RepID=A0AAV5MGQ4_9ROSI|nr:hypothetical protein SLEP1_g55563 [Rubroshorea leprosula]
MAVHLEFWNLCKGFSVLVFQIIFFAVNIRESLLRSSDTC